METKIKNEWLNFYFGSIEESRRLHLERELLTDPEALVKFLDLKREIEGAEIVPSRPSDLLWQRLRPLAKRRTWRIAFLAGLVAASLAAFYFLSMRHPSSSDSGVLFDSGAEQSSAANVL